MFKKVLITSALALATATTATAGNFSTTVDVTKVLTPISMTQKTALQLPVVKVDESTPEGEVLCTTDTHDYHPGKDYCTGAGVNGVYTITGAPHATIALTMPHVGVTQDGFTFRGYGPTSFSSGYGVTTDATGEYELTLRGYIYLEDFDAVTSKNYVFDFEIATVYY